MTILNSEEEKYIIQEIFEERNKINYTNQNTYEFFKRIIDIVFCLITLLPVTFIIIIFSIIIIIESPGNPFFNQVRVGKDGKFFRIHKLRSMKLDAEKNGQKWASESDDRILRIGKFIRRFRIDELPQVFNILVGEMSLIGPRPEIPQLTIEFNQEIPGFVNRLLVVPGLSGYAQVEGGYDLTPNEKLIKDIYYIENRSFKLYIQIFFKSILIVFTGKGAR